MTPREDQEPLGPERLLGAKLLTAIRSVRSEREPVERIETDLRFRPVSRFGTGRGRLRRHHPFHADSKRK